MTRYPALLWRDEDDWAVTFPDLPGCVAGGSDGNAALLQAEEALGFHLDGLKSLTPDLPAPSPLDWVLASGLAAGAVGTALVEPRTPKAPAVRVNITVDKSLLAEIDAQAAATGQTRSGFLAEAARRMLPDR